jgi:hypothetical protein
MDLRASLVNQLNEKSFTSIQIHRWKCKINFTNSIEKRTVQVFSVLGRKF